MNTKVSNRCMMLTGKRSWGVKAMLTVMLFMIATYYHDANAQDVRVPEVDSLALVAFYHSMSGADWNNNGGWLVDRVDTWFGITTENVGTVEEPEYRVVKIQLNNNMRSPGTLPPELGDMEYLADLVLRGDPALFGEWPTEISGLGRISEIRTQRTNMSGEIPWTSFAATPIRRIRLQSAQHRGEIPDLVFNDMTQLQRIEISNQYISGNFPSSITSLTGLRRLRLQGNLLEGDIPDLGHIEGVEQFHLNGNPLNPGPIWPWIANWGESLEELRLDNTNRTGSVPEWLINNMFAVQELTLGEQTWDLDGALGGPFPDLSSLIELDQLHIHGPHWEGNLPAWIGTKAMNRVYFYYCSFKGDIPGSYATVTGIVHIMSCPEVTGGIPANFELFTGTNLVINMSDSWNNPYSRFGSEAATYFGNPSMQVGDIPSYIGSWGSRDIRLSNVGLTGSIPTSILSNNGLEALDLSNNPQLTGDLPVGLFDLDLELLNLSNTGLNISSIPTDLSKRELTLTSLGLSGLGMTGEIPAFLGDFPLLQNIDLSNNDLTGGIPSSIGNLSLLISLNLADNDLSGELPATFQDMGYLAGFYTLNAIDLSGNANLSGELPQRLSEASLMQVMRYDGTNISRPDDNTFNEWLVTTIPSNSGLSFPALYTDVQTSDLVGTSIESTDNPYIFKLDNNYPNPFNPTTKISYQIPEAGLVTLTVYNILGQQVAQLVNETQNAGVYEINFDAHRLSSGIYMYRLEAGAYTSTRSMTLVK